MTDSIALRNEIISAGLKFNFVAKELGITPFGLQKKIDNVTEFKASEIKKLCEILNLGGKTRDKIFFATNRD